MGRIARFFGNPGARPAIHHRAPLINTCCDDETGVCHSYNSRNNYPNNTTVEYNDPNTLNCIEQIHNNDDNKEVLKIMTITDGEKLMKIKETTQEESLFTDSESTLVQNSLADVDIDKEKGEILSSIGFTGLKKYKTDKALDWMVDFAGSIFMFIIMWIILIIWIIIGAIYGAPDVWQVVMEDGQSIQTYIWDTLLMRQQLMSAHDQILVCANIRSRIGTFRSFLLRRNDYNPEFNNYNPNINEVNDINIDNGTVLEEEVLDSEALNNNTNEQQQDKDNKIQTNVVDGEYMSNSSTNSANDDDIVASLKDIDIDIPIEGLYDRLCTICSEIQGSLYFIILYWIGIIIWIICGVIPSNAGNSPPYTGETTGSNPRKKKFSDTWQMYINTAVAVALMISSTFLQNIRARHDKFIARYLSTVRDLDAKIDFKLRSYYGDFKKQNPIITIPAEKRSWTERQIDTYADVIGTGIGLVITAAAFGVWFGLGTTLHWSDDWWLIIGTYTGLVGFIDGFVIRNVYMRVVHKEEEYFTEVANDDLRVFQEINLHCPEEFNGLYKFDVNEKSLNYKISRFINFFCSTSFSVYVSIAVVLGLIAAACGMLWSTVGQLICNTPTMIIEEFFLLVLIQAHNWADKQRRIEVTSLYARRRLLLDFVNKHF